MHLLSHKGQIYKAVQLQLKDNSVVEDFKLISNSYLFFKIIFQTNKKKYPQVDT